jgi:hypothetical protein
MSRFKKATREKLKLRMAIDGPSGSGKAQSLDSKVLTPTGWRQMGELSPGDRVIGANGMPCRITHIHPQGKKDLFNVVFSDGSSTLCCMEHLWLTQTVLDRGAFNCKGRPGTVKSLAEISRSVRDKHGKRNHSIPMVQPVQFDQPEPLPLDPYLMGVLLGDGHFDQRFVTVTNPEPSIQAAIVRSLPEDTFLKSINDDGLQFAIRRFSPQHRNRVVQVIRQLGLAGKKSTEKFVPDVFKFAHLENRIALLQGLLDTDGYACGFTLEYSTSSPWLASDFQFLVESLGGVVTVKERLPIYTYRGEKKAGALSHRIYVSLPGPICPFRLERKAKAYRSRTKYQPRRFVESIEYAGPMEAKCITLDSPDQLYVTDNCIVTHNSYTGLRFAFTLATQLGNGRVAGIDSEHESMRKYTGDSPDGIPFEFDVLELKNNAPTAYTEAIVEAGREGYDVILVDSLSHAWVGEGGALELKDKAGQSQTAWKDITPMHNRMIESILKSPAHVICTMRSKTDWVYDEVVDERTGRKKTVPRKVGLAPVQRPGMEYEFDLYGSMDWSHILTISKSRCTALQDQTSVKPGAEFLAPLIAWLDAGVEPTKPKLVSPEQLERINELIAKLGARPGQTLVELKKHFGIEGFTEDKTAAALASMTEVQGVAFEGRLWKLVEKKNGQAAAALTPAPATTVTAPSGNGS